MGLIVLASHVRVVGSPTASCWVLRLVEVFFSSEVLVFFHGEEFDDFDRVFLAFYWEGNHSCFDESVSFFFCLELDDDTNRPKDLFTDDLHIGCDVGEDSRLDKEAPVAVPLSSYLDTRASFLA